MCGYDVRLGNRELGLEVRHIKWHQAGGPDTEVNGLALCVLHHKLFDCGAYGMVRAVIGASHREFQQQPSACFDNDHRATPDLWPVPVLSAVNE